MKLFKFGFGFGFGVIRAKVGFEFFNEKVEI